VCLAALALMRHASEIGGKGKSFVIAIEEPESHLHPSAIHVLRKVINELAQKYQVVITTHSPLFVDRSNIRSNILVKDNRAVPAKSVDQIRSILGVRASDSEALTTIPSEPIATTRFRPWPTRGNRARLRA
jgi:putative ATP-dependent endonuclease of OLD family